MKRLGLGTDAWRLGVGVQTLALTAHASPIGYGGRALAVGGLVVIALLTLQMAMSRPSMPRWLMWWAGVAAAFCAFAAASSLWSLSLRVSLEDAVTTALMLAFVLLTVASRWQDQARLRADLTFIFGLIVLLQVSALLAGMVGVDTIYDPDYGRFRGWFSNANYAGIMSAVGLSIGVGTLIAQPDVVTPALGSDPGRTLANRKVLWAVAGCALLLAALVLAQSRGAMLALALSICVLVFPRLGWRRALAVVALAVVVGGAGVVLRGLTNGSLGAGSESGGRPTRTFDPVTRDQDTDVTSGRVEIYKELVSEVKAHPVAGTGYRTTELNPALDGSAGHNIYLSTFAELGPVGGLLFLALLGIPVLQALSTYRPMLGAASAVGAAMVAMSEVFESSILGWGSPTALMAWLVVAAGASAVATRQHRESAVKAA